MKFNKLKSSTPDVKTQPPGRGATDPTGGTPANKTKANRNFTWNRIWAGILTLLVIGGGVYLFVNISWVVTTGMVNTSTTAVASLTGGRVVEIMVGDGANVKEGQPIMKLANPAIQARYDAAKAQLDIARARFTRLEASGFGENVQTSFAKLSKARIRHDAAVRNATRAERLLLLDAITRSRYEDALIQLAETAADRNLAEAEWRGTKAASSTTGEGIEVDLKNEMSAAEASLSEAEAALADLTLVAPSTGQMTWLTKNRGDIVKPWEAVAHVIKPEYQIIDTYVRLSDLKDIAPGSKASVRFGNFGGGLDGVVTVVGPRVSLSDDSNFVGPERAITPSRIDDLVTVVQIRLTNTVPANIKPGETVNVWIKRN